MDIAYLLALQSARETLGNAVELLFLGISFIGQGPLLIALVLIVYWCVDKRAGYFAMTSFTLGNFVNSFIKNLVCAYRPWIRDARVHPPEAALGGAGGYSFPSGHTCGTATSLGSFAWLYRSKHRTISVACLIVVFLVAFSRNYLGVHTPQDVLVGLVEAVLAIWASSALVRMLEAHPERDALVVAVTLVVVVLSIAVVMLKPYPIDYVDGEVLVDPVKMQKGSFEAAGIVLGLVFGWFFEHRTVAFSTDGLPARTRTGRGVFGVICTVAVYIVTDLVFKEVFPATWAKLFAMFVVVFVAIYVVPRCFERIDSFMERAGD